MKILLFGKNGQLGWELQRSLAPLGEVTALGSSDVGGDYRRLDEVRQFVRRLAPQVIVNAGAYTAVDKAESEPDLAHQLNAVAPGLLATEARQLDAWLVHYSTDYVFDGSGTRPWRETDAPNPLNTYGRSKLAGEQAIQGSGCRHLIFRTSWVYAARGNNFARTMLRLAQTRDTLRVVDDQMGAPTGADLLADVTAHAVRQMRGGPAAGGLYHLVAAGETSWYDYARLVLTQAAQRGVSLRVQPDAIQPIASSEFPQPAVRPLNSRLSTEKLRRDFEVVLPPWQAGVVRLLDELPGQST